MVAINSQEIEPLINRFELPIGELSELNEDSSGMLLALVVFVVSVLSSSDYLVTALDIFQSAIVGIILASILLIVTIARATFKNAFGYFCVSQILADLILLILFASCIPAEIMWPQSINDLVLLYVGWWSLSLQFISHYACLLMSLNRFCAVFFPLRYNHLFTNEKARTFVVISWFLGFGQCSIYLIDGCNFSFSGETLHFSFQSTVCGFYVSVIQEIIYNFSLAFFVILLDLMALLKLKFIYNEAQRNGRKGAMDIYAKEFRQFAQAIASAVIYVVMQMCFHIGSRITNDKLIRFFLTAYAWELYLVFSQIATIAIYKVLRDITEQIHLCFLQKKRGVERNETIAVEIPENFI
uniref:G_PROTEIN_RECEP_F1_2 domain-containing protein n=1 Tax=Heterorhabditis bacteriophora TaxID=37862 RepID=A0A1I7XCF1_HETBA